jgi:predicted signal transduction protein with EAL and GGDEF domain
MSPSQADTQERGAWARRHNHALVALARHVWQEGCTLEHAFALICETAAATLGVERVNIWRLDDARGELHCLHLHAGGRGPRRIPAEDAVLPLGQDYRAALDEVRVIDPSALDGPAHGLAAYLARNRIGSLLDAPVRSAGRLVGVVCHEHVGDPRRWKPEDLAFAGSIGDYIALAMEIDQRRRLQGRVRYLELHDPHTGLPNRDHLLDVVHAALRPAHGAEAGLAAIHLDLDASPHEGDAGHELLVEPAARLRRELDGEATLARVRGNAFAVLPHRQLDDTGALLLAERCADLVQHCLDEQGIAVVVSAGIAFARDLAAPSADNLLRNAEIASHRARDHRHGRCEVFDAQRHRGLVERLRLERQVREAHEAGQMCVQFQPEVDLASGRWVAAEALLRWRDAQGRCRAAGEFIEIIENSGLIVPIGRWVLGEACALARTWPGEGDAAPRLRVNLSARQFEQASLVEDVATALEDSGLAPGRLCLELTESVLVRDVALAAQTFARLRALGVSIALDDFGTGYSSLAYLRRLPVDVIKIDRCFVAGLPHDPYDLAIVQAVATLARRVGIEVVAEGVETAAQADALLACGVERAQGYLFAAALDPDLLLQRFAAQQPAPQQAPV